MNLVWIRLLETVDAQGLAALASVVAVAGSAPREAGARLVLRPDGGFWGTVGGGQLEWSLIGEARAALAAGRGPAQARDWPLGPDLGQCCGGRVTTWVETFDARDRDMLARFAALEAAGRFDVAACPGEDGRVVRRVLSSADRAPAEGVVERFGDDGAPVLLFGAGHVGRALAIALAPLPFRLTWVDSRAGEFPAHIPANATVRVADNPVEVVGSAPPGAFVMVMTHSHPLDLAVTTAALKRTELGPVGLIGSATKRARFLKRMREAGLSDAALARLVCPIGAPGVSGKEPAVIAAMTAAQLLQWRDAALRIAHGGADWLKVAGAGRTRRH
ncbi:xanthine dehydrogenase accessory protein XdhC [Alsobacter sp. KACC 23698]|uniref:Xanthine dehydrogenase accessory protein XdhC n=1 Tax=Alsobacter sp. KACC 23698 TaxID=3149229 RepID=A0AAU7JIC0_9HYPH